MPIQAKPLFRSDVLRPKLDAFAMPADIDAKRPALEKWRDFIESKKIDKCKETEVLPDFITDYFQSILGYKSLIENPDRYTIKRESLVQVDVLCTKTRLHC